MKGFHIPTLQKIEVLASKIMQQGKSANAALLEATRSVRDAGTWGTTKAPKASQKTAIGAKKIDGKRKPAQAAAQTKIFNKKQYKLIGEVKTKVEVNKAKMDCNNACYFIKTVNPKGRGDTYKLYGRKK